jgi:uncharacterized protein (DUF1684 family)
VDALDILDWRRQVTALYAAVRAADPEEGHRLWREGRDRLFASHPASPIPAEERAGFTGLPVADYDPSWRFELPLLPAEPRLWEVETGTDGVVPFQLVGRVEVPDAGPLDVWWLDSYGGGLFLPVGDPSLDTYGGGRYLLDTVKGADLGPGRAALLVDFNFAYNPSCAYDEAWACPLAPPGNRLAVAVPVGERYHPEAESR